MVLSKHTIPSGGGCTWSGPRGNAGKIQGGASDRANAVAVTCFASAALNSAGQTSVALSGLFFLIDSHLPNGDITCAFFTLHPRSGQMLIETDNDHQFYSPYI